MRAEPMPPEGISVADLSAQLQAAFGQRGEDLFTWLAVTYPVWARSLAGRLVGARAFCEHLGGTELTPPS